MKVCVVAVGRPGPLLRDAISEYEQRAARYWTLQTIEVKEEKARALPDERVRELEAERLIEKTPAGYDLVALTRTGESWSSSKLATYLQQLGVQSRPGVAFVIGGAYGLGAALLQRANRQLSLSPMTLPHELARLFLAEQLYRAGTISRNEPYHKARE